MTTISVWSHRGGVGKTTLATNMAGRIAAEGGRTLLVNLDPQANAVDRLGIEADDNAGWDSGRSWAGALTGANGTAVQVVADARRQHLHVASVGPATVDGMRTEAMSPEDLEQRYATLLVGLAADHDYVVIDCPPSISPQSMAALRVAHGIVVPVATPGQDSLNALGDLVTAANDRGVLQRIVGIVPMFWPTQTLHRRRHQQWREELNEVFSEAGVFLQQWPGFIRHLPKLGIELEDTGLLVHELAERPESRTAAANRVIDTANDFTELTQWVLDRIHTKVFVA